MKVYRAAILGCGNIAGGYDSRLRDNQVWTHAKGYQQNPGFSLAAAADADPARAKAFCKEWKIPRVCRDLREVLDSVQPEVLSICTPNATHYPLLKEALAYPGLKALFCEKPLTLQLTEAREIAEACRRKGIVLAVNYFRRWDSALGKLGTEIQRGAYGGLRRGRVYYTKGVFHNASHGINLFQPWLGPVAAVSVAGGERLPDGDILADFSLRYDSGTEIDFRAGDYQNYNFFEIDLFFESARIRLPMGNSIEVQTREPSKFIAGEFSLGPPETIASTVGTAIPRLLQNLYEALESGVPLTMPAEEAASTIETCEAIRNALAKKIG